MASKQEKKEVVNLKDINLDDIIVYKIDNDNKYLKSVNSKIIPMHISDKNNNEFVFKLEGTVAFDCKKLENENKYNLSLNIHKDIIKFIQNDFKQKIIDLVYDNKDTNNHFKEDDEIDKEFIEENIKEILYYDKKKKYDPSVQLSIKENRFYNIVFDKMIKENVSTEKEPIYKLIKNPNFEELLKRGTKIETLLCFRHINSEPSKIKPVLQIKGINIINKQSYEKNYINWTKEEFEKHEFTLTNPIQAEGGIPGKKGYINCDGKQFSIKIKGGLAPFNIMNTDKTSGKEYYGLSVSLKDEGIEASEYLYEKVSQELSSQSNEFFGKKMTLKSICKKLSTIQSMSSKDLENYKKKLPLEYPPNLGFKIYKKRDSDEYNFVFKDSNNNILSPNTLEEYKKENKSAIYEIEGSLQHIWYGSTTTSVKWILNTVKIIEDGSSANVLYQGFDEDIQTETTTNDESENKEDSESENKEDDESENKEDSESENNDEPENSDED